MTPNGKIQFLTCYYRETPMGVMSWDPDKNEGWFDYYSAFWNKGLPFSPIFSPTGIRGMKPESIPFKRQMGELIGFPAFFTDFLPGKFAMYLLKHVLKDSPIKPEKLSPLGWCSLLGRRGTGVFGFDPAGFPELDAVEQVDIGHLVRWCNQLSLTDKPLSDNRLRELLRTSLFTHSSRPVAQVAVNDFTGEMLSGQSNLPAGFEAWNLLIDGIQSDVEGVDNRRLQDYFRFYQHASAVGLELLPCRVIHAGQQRHLLSKRLDRQGKHRVHIQSFAAIMGAANLQPSDSCESLFSCMRQMRLPYNEQVELFKRLVFYAMEAHRLPDAHEVWFVFERDTTWKLAPCDGFPPALTGNLSLGGKYSDWTTADYLQLGKAIHLRRYESVLKSIQTAVDALT